MPCQKNTGGLSRLRRRTRGGFTLLEVIVVLLLISGLTLALSGRFTATNVRAVAEADALKSALRYAQSRAMADVYTWGVSITSGSYTLVEDNPNVSGAVLPGGTGATYTLPTGVGITSGSVTIRFDWRGQPVSNQITDPSTQTSTAVTTSQTITVTQASGVSVVVTPYTGFIQ